MFDREDLIRKRAHQIWKERGCPEGEDAMHWHQAAAEIDRLADAGRDDGDTRRSDMTVHEPPPLATTREAAAFALANTRSSQDL